MPFLATGHGELCCLDFFKRNSGEIGVKPESLSVNSLNIILLTYGRFMCRNRHFINKWRHAQKKTKNCVFARDIVRHEFNEWMVIYTELCFIILGSFHPKHILAGSYSNNFETRSFIHNSTIISLSLNLSSWKTMVQLWCIVTSMMVDNKGAMGQESMVLF